MADNVTYQNDTYATPAKGVDVETNQQPDGSHRQVVSVGDSALPTGAATASAQTDGSQQSQITLGGSLVSDENPFPVCLGARAYTGTLGALGAELDMECDGRGGTVVFQVSGTWKGKIVIEGAIDGLFANLSIVQPGGAISFAGVNNDNENGVYRVLIIAGYTHVRFRMSSYTSGTATVIANAAQLVPTPFVWQLNQANLNGTAYQGGTWNITNVSGTVSLPTGAATSANQTNGNQLTQITQHVDADANNSSSTNLAAGNGYTFAGTSSSTLGVAGIQVSLFADKNCKVLVEQSPNGTNWDIVDTYYYSASATNFGITVQAVNSYVRVVVSTNNETTTAFRLQTALCPVVEALPRSLDKNGNFKISSMTDRYGWEAENTPYGEMRTVEPTRLVGTIFDGTTIDANFWITAAAGTSAAIAQANAQLLITSGTSSGATVTAFTTRRARYVGGTGMRFRGVIQAAAGTANNTRRWGIGWGSTAMPTVTDGAWFQLSGTTFQVVTMKGGSATAVSSFNGQLGATFDIGTDVRTYEIYWTNSRVYFVIGDTILHTVSASSATWSNTMSYHAFADSVNSDIATSVTLAARVITIYRLGKVTTQPQYYYFANGQTAGVNLKLGAGNLHSMIINGITNNSTITLSDSTSAATPAIFVHTAGATATGVVSIDFKGLPFSNGLRLIVATQNASVTVIYE